MFGVIVRKLRQLYPGSSIHAFSAQPEETEQLHQVYVPQVFVTGRHIGPLAALLRVWRVSAYDLVVLGGGTILQDLHGVMHLVEMALMAILCRLRNRPLVLLGVGAAGLERAVSRLAVWVLAQCATGIAVRDRESFQLLQRLAGSAKEKLLLAEDLVYLADEVRSASPSHSEKEPVTRTETYIVASVLAVHEAVDKDTVRQRQLETTLASVFDDVLERTGKRIRFVPMKLAVGPNDVDDDVATARRIQSQMKYGSRVEVLDTKDVRERIDVIKNAEVAVGMRLHFNLIATVLGVPTVAIAYNPKVRSFMRATDQELFTVDLSHDQLWKLPDLVLHRMAFGGSRHIPIQRLQDAAALNWRVLEKVSSRA